LRSRLRAVHSAVDLGAEAWHVTNS
jgi:hypothetical protein